MSKRRVTIRIDKALLEAANEMVASGRAESFSARMSGAMAERLATERRLDALAALVADYETQHGSITEAELAEQEEFDRDAAADSRRRSRLAG